MSQPAGPPVPAARLVATSFLSLFSIVGLCLYGLPFYYDFYVRDLGWSRTQVTAGNAIGKLVVGPLLGFFVGWIIDRIGPRRPMMAGLLLACVALVGLGFTTTLPTFFFFYVLNAIAYVTAGPLANQVLLSRSFGEGRGRALGVAYLGIGFGLLVVPHLSRALVAGLGWRHALVALGGIVLVVALPLVVALRDPAPGRRTEGAAPLRPALRGALFYLLALGSMASIGAVGGTNQHLKLLLTLDQGRSQAQAASLLTVIGACSLVGRVATGWLADRFGPKPVMIAVYGLVTAATLLLVGAPAGAGLWSFAVVFGLGLGGEYLVIPLMVAELYGTAVLGRLLGLVLTADGIAEAVFPVLVGRLRDQSGSYGSSFRLLAATSLLGTIAVALLPGRRAPRR